MNKEIINTICSSLEEDIDKKTNKEIMRLQEYSKGYKQACGDVFRLCVRELNREENVENE